MLTKSLAVAALAAAPALATSAVNIYWGQKGTPQDRLRNFCDSSVEYVTVGFINTSPEHDKSALKYPGSDFGQHCAAAVYTDTNGVKTKLFSQCGEISADVRYCQKKGKKVLLSIGGEAGGDYSVKNAAEGEYFANFVWGAFGPYKSSWGKKARPFDDYYGADPGDEHFVFDGFDFDLETNFRKLPLVLAAPRPRL